MKSKNPFYTEYINLNGIKHFLLHYPSNPTLPVILFLHGGPGMAESLFSYYFQASIGENYQVVHWDQRGAGKTLSKNKPLHYPSLQESIQDLKAVIEYLKVKYTKQKIVLLGHSWGSLFGSIYLMTYPEDVEYYIGVAQVVDIIENENKGFDALKSKILASKNKKDLRIIESIGVYPEHNYELSMIKKLQKVRLLQSKYKIGMNFKPILRTMFRSPIFRLSDIFSLFKGMMFNKPLWEYLFQHSLFEFPIDYPVNVYYILGEMDFQAPYHLAQSYFDLINTAQKKCFIVPEAGHFLMLDQPERFSSILGEISMQEH